MAAVWWGVAPRRCSHSNTFFEKPLKTVEILILFGSKSSFPYKMNGKSMISAPKAAPECSWQLLAASGSFRQLLAAPGSSWQLLAAPGSSWQLLAAPGSSWQLLAAPGSPWQPLAATKLIFCMIFGLGGRKIVITRRSRQLQSSYFACADLWTC